MKTLSARVPICLSFLALAVPLGLSAQDVPAAAVGDATAGPVSDGVAAAKPRTFPVDGTLENRSIIAVPAGGGKCFVSWRLLPSDPDEVAFNLYRWYGSGRPVLLNREPLTDATCFVDEDYRSSRATQYLVRTVVAGEELPGYDGFEVAANAPVGYLEIPLETPRRYTPNDASVGDLDGDGDYEIVLKQEGRAHDNAHEGETDPVILQAYELDGTLMWEIDLGKNIRAGAHYTQFMVYDLDGDGKAEVACKTADGTRDGAGDYIGERNADYVNRSGRILEGPEYLTVFDGSTGAALSTVPYIPQRFPGKDDPDGGEMDRIWGDNYGNRIDRFLACIAWLDGERPSLVMCRGYYTRTVLAAWNFEDGELRHLWTFDTLDNPEARGYAGQGNHGLSVADVDADGRDEIIYGACTIDDDGTGLYTTGLYHGDALHVGDLDPDRPGLEVWAIHENPSDRRPGTTFRDARTGEIIFRDDMGIDIGRGLAADVDPRFPGAELFGSRSGVKTAKGEVVDVGGGNNFTIWWDGDLQREILNSNYIDKWDWEAGEVRRLLQPEEARSNNGTKSTPTLSADLFGDWREEVIWRHEDGDSLLLYTTTIPTEHRMPTLMADRQYRLAIAWQNVAYNQPPHPSFDLVSGPPPRAAEEPEEPAAAETVIEPGDAAAGEDAAVVEPEVRDAFDI